MLFVLHAVMDTLNVATSPPSGDAFEVLAIVGIDSVYYACIRMIGTVMKVSAILRGGPALAIADAE